MKLIKPFIETDEFLNRDERFCIWIEDSQLKEAKLIPEINERINGVKAMRLNSTKIATKRMA